MLNSALDAIGNTPLIRLKKASEITGCEIYGKAEFLNPGQSVRTAQRFTLSVMPKNADCSSPAALSLKVQQETPASALLLLPRRLAIAL